MIASPIRSPIRSAISSVFERRASGGAAAFDPAAALFGAAELGAWYDPSDISTLFQDSAGTVPVTTAGQVVGRINDKSGRGNHATQATTAQKPIYRVDGGGRPYLEFDGVDDTLLSPSIAFGGGAASFFYGHENIGLAQWVPIWMAVSPSDSFFSAAQSGNAAAPHGAAVGTPAYRVDTVTLSPATRGQLFTQQALSKSIVTVTGLALPTSAVRIAGYSGFQMRGNLYAFILRGAATSGALLDSTEAYINSKTGAY